MAGRKPIRGSKRVIKKHVKKRPPFRKKKDRKKSYKNEEVSEPLHQSQCDNEPHDIDEGTAVPGEDSPHDPPLQPLEMLLSTFKTLKSDSRKLMDSRHENSKIVKSVEIKEEEIVSDSNNMELGTERNDTACIDSNVVEPINDVRASEEDVEIDDMELSDKDKVDFDLESTDLTDPFNSHFNYDLSATLLEALTSNPVKATKTDIYWPNLHNLRVEYPTYEDEYCTNEQNQTLLDGQTVYAKVFGVPKLPTTLNWDELNVKSQIQPKIGKANKSQLNGNHSEELTGLQKEIFCILNNYQDFFYSERNLVNGEEVRFVYCLHAVNHILKTRLRILHHNEKLLKRVDHQVPDEYRDQGLVRPKVIILVPFKESCRRIVNMLSSILIDKDKGNIINKSRFEEEFSGSELIIPKINAKPEDYELLFKGNIDDKFKIGISITKKSLKLYSDFYSSDIIIASPLGLRLVIGAEGDKKRDFDFLASVEILILDQTELFLMQNWDHLLLILDHLHIQPKESHGVDFSRIRSWVLQGWSKFYRQTLIFSSVVTPELNAIFNRRCLNFAGKVRVMNPVEFGSISRVITSLSHIFQKFNAESILTACETRFQFFTEKILVQYKDPSFSGVLIYVPSYFDYVKIRNYLKREEYSFVQICEYSKDGKIARARDKFFHREVRFLLYSERFHFFRRIRLKGIRHIIFYQLPIFPHFYSELCNLMKVIGDGNYTGECNPSVMTLYCKYDIYQLSAVVKTSRASTMISSPKEVHMFTTE